MNMAKTTTTKTLIQAENVLDFRFEEDAPLLNKYVVIFNANVTFKSHRRLLLIHFTCQIRQPCESQLYLFAWEISLG